jgi:lysyl-tRNA synthetase class 2
MRSKAGFGRGRRTVSAVRLRRLAALSAGAAGIVTAASQLGRIPDGGIPFERLLGFAAAAGLAVLARGLAAGRRRALLAAVVLLLAVGVVRLVEGLGPLDAAIDAALAAALVAGRRAFPCGGASVGPWPGILGAGSAAAAYVVYATAEISARGGTDVDRAIGHTGAVNTWLLAPHSPAAVGIDALVAIALLAAGRATLGLLRPAPGSDGHLPAEHRRAAALVARHGADTLDPFALREDKAFHFDAGGVLAYRVLRETAVVAGDPIAPPGRAPDVLRSFLALAERRGWDVVVTAASPRHLDGYKRLGLRALEIGREAVLDPRAFSLEGRSIRKVRQAVARAERRGWSTAVAVGHAPPLLRAELAEVEAAWRARQPRLHGFAMTLGRLWGAEEDEDAVYALARDPAGRLRTFVRFVRFRGGLSLDTIRRGGDEPNGLVEALVVEAIRWAAAENLETVSLNFAGFAHVMAAEAALGARQRVLRAALRRARGRFQLERLVRFNKQFEPQWRPRYLIYRDIGQLPRAALRVLQAEAYVTPPRSRELTPRWRPDPLPRGATTASAGARR